MLEVEPGVITKVKTGLKSQRKDKPSINQDEKPKNRAGGNIRIRNRKPETGEAKHLTNIENWNQSQESKLENQQASAWMVRSKNFTFAQTKRLCDGPGF